MAGNQLNGMLKIIISICIIIGFIGTGLRLFFRVDIVESAQSETIKIVEKLDKVQHAQGVAIEKINVHMEYLKIGNDDIKTLLGEIRKDINGGG